MTKMEILRLLQPCKNENNKKKLFLIDLVIKKIQKYFCKNFSGFAWKGNIIERMMCLANDRICLQSVQRSWNCYRLNYLKLPLPPLAA